MFIKFSIFLCIFLSLAQNALSQKKQPIIIYRLGEGANSLLSIKIMRNKVLYERDKKNSLRASYKNIMRIKELKGYKNFLISLTLNELRELRISQEDMERNSCSATKIIYNVNESFTIPYVTKCKKNETMTSKLDSLHQVFTIIKNMVL